MQPIQELDSEASESDVEQKLIYPLLIDPSWLGYPPQAIKTKEYVTEATLSKGAAKKRGYVPDYTIWLYGLPAAIIEAKRPAESAEVAFREAQEYAHVINKKYPTKFNPVQICLGTNGKTILVGPWDGEPEAIPVHNLVVGNQYHARLTDSVGYSSIKNTLRELSNSRAKTKHYLPYNQQGGAGLLRVRLPFNEFAEQITTLVSRYFESDNPTEEDEIIEHAYISSEQNTRYNRVFENYLRENTSTKIGGVLKELNPTQRSEKNLTSALKVLSSANPKGKMQIILGGVGSGKSTFIKRYYRYLMDQSVRSKTRWVFFDFNTMPDNLDNAETEICREFIEQIANELPEPSIYAPDEIRKIFKEDIRSLEGAYKYLEKNDLEEYHRRIANDLRDWMLDKTLFARRLASHIQKERGLRLVSIFDNVDRRDRAQQLQTFQVAEWFRKLTSSFCVITLRDETYEVYKNEPPLDAFQNGVHFFIKPPRFADTVRKRLELCLEYLSHESPENLSYTTRDGHTITFPNSNLGHFLRSLYVDIFQSDRRVTWLMESLAGRNIRKALSMFTQILMSGHLNETNLSRVILTGGEYSIPENMVIRILMRTDRLYFSEDSGFIKNLFDPPKGLSIPNNFILLEVLQFLYERRKSKGSLRMEGYYTVHQVADELGKMGFPRKDVLTAAEHLLRQGLITTDDMRESDLDFVHAIRIHASGFIHLRILAERIEYVSACAFVTQMSDRESAEKIGAAWQMDGGRTDITQKKKQTVVSEFLKYLRGEQADWTRKNAFFDESGRGTELALQAIQSGLDWSHQGKARRGQVGTKKMI